MLVSGRYLESYPSVMVPFVFGSIVAAMIYAVGHISGAHFNPAVTLGFVIGRHFPLKDLLPYWASQIAGAIVAVFFLKILMPDTIGYGGTLPQVGVLSAIVWEIVLTFFLMFVIISVATDTRAVGVMAGAAIGLTVMIGSFVGGPFTGASMNPARTIGPAVFESQWSTLYIYLIGPMIGASLAAWVYEKIRCDRSEGGSGAKGCC